MGLVSEEVGNNIKNQFIQPFEQFILALLNTISIKNAQKGFTDASENGAKALIKHINAGGHTRMQVVSSDDKALFLSILKNEGVPFAMVSQEIDGKSQCIFVTRDKDNRKVDRAWDRYAFEIQRSFKEMTPQELMHNCENSKLLVAKGYSEVEIEAFRTEAVKTGLNFSIIKSEAGHGMFDILYPEQEKSIAESTFLGMEYEFTGEDGALYKDEIEKSVKEKNKILAEARNAKNVMYIVSVENPNVFITVSDGTLVEHSLTKKMKPSKDGKQKEVVSDNIRKTFPFGNRELTKALKKLGNCVVVSEKDISYIKGLDSSKRAILPSAEEVGKSTEELKPVLSKRSDIYKPFVTRKSSAVFGKLVTLSNIDDDRIPTLVSNFEKAGIPVCIVGDALAYEERYCSEAEKIIDNTLYHGMDYKEKFETMMFYEKRGPEKGFSLDKPSPDIYIVSAKNPELVVHVSNDGIEVQEKGEVKLTVSRTSPQYNESLEAIIGSMQDVAVLLKDEMEKNPAERIRLIEERTGEHENEASIQLEMNHEEKKKEFVTNSCTHGSLSNNEEREALSRYERHEVTEIYVDRTFTEKVADMDFGTKRVEEEHVRKETSHEIG